MKRFVLGAGIAAAVAGASPAAADPIIISGTVLPDGIIGAGLPDDFVRGIYTLKLSVPISQLPPTAFAEGIGTCLIIQYYQYRPPTGDRYNCVGATLERQSGRLFGEISWLPSGHSESPPDFSFDVTRESPGALWIHPYVDAPAQYTLTIFQSVPEPGAWAMLILGFTAAGLAVRRRRRCLTGGRSIGSSLPSTPNQ